MRLPTFILAKQYESGAMKKSRTVVHSQFEVAPPISALNLDNAGELPLEHRVLGPILKARAAQDWERVFMRFGEDKWTFGDTFEIVHAAAGGFVGLDLLKGQRVGLFMPNHPAFIFAWWGVNLAGGVTVPINPSFTSELLEYVLDDADAQGLITTAALLRVVQAVEPDRLRRLKFVVTIEPPAAPSHPFFPLLGFEELCERGRARGGEVNFPLDFRDAHSVMYTSGTTGPSKGALVPNGHYFGASCTFIRALALSRDDVLFTPLPLFHGLASRLGALPCWMVGAEYVLGSRFSVSRFWQQVVEAGATVAHTIFTLPTMLKSQAPGPYDQAHRLRAMYNSNYDPEFEQRFGVPIFEAFGLTEVGLTHYTRFPDRRPGSCGKTHEEWETRLVDERGIEVPTGEVGEITVRPRLPSIMMDGYINKPAETLRASRDMWFHTSDFGRMDADGYLYFVSRAKDRIRRRGENVTPAEIESIVVQHPDVAECAALAHPAAEGEDDIRVVLVTRENFKQPTPAQVMDWLVQRMPYFMLPRYIEFAAALPRNPVGKVEKYKLVDGGMSAEVWDREKAGYEVHRAVTALPTSRTSVG